MYNRLIFFWSTPVFYHTASSPPHHKATRCCHSVQAFISKWAKHNMSLTFLSDFKITFNCWKHSESSDILETRSIPKPAWCLVYWSPEVKGQPRMSKVRAKIKKREVVGGGWEAIQCSCIMYFSTLHFFVSTSIHPLFPNFNVPVYFEEGGFTVCNI